MAISMQLAPLTTSLLVVIVNYRTPNLTIDCLRSLVDEVVALPGVQVVVTDNASGDDSIAQINAAITAEGWNGWVTFMPLDCNGGFAYGNNAAICPALAAAQPPDYVLLLNPDTVVHPGAIRTLLDFMHQHPEAGIAGSRLEDPDGTPQRSAFRFHSFLSELDGSFRIGLVSKLLDRWIVAPPVSDTPCETDWVAGASMMIRRQVFESAGLLDEGYFMYYEEMDFCLQSRRSGWTCWYVPESRVIHLVGQSSGVTNMKQPKRLPQYVFDSRRRYFLKNHGWLYTALTDACWAVGFSLWKVRQTLQGKQNFDPPQLLKDFMGNSVFMRGVTLTP
jgi:N-acetylglucosaminyl-diphospho-decaprenol L-rhamnosyltransferase